MLSSERVTLLTLLGSTGSIGTSTLDVVRMWPDRFGVYALVAGRNVELLARQSPDGFSSVGTTDGDVAGGAEQPAKNLAGVRVVLDHQDRGGDWRRGRHPATHEAS